MSVLVSAVDPLLELSSYQLSLLRDFKLWVEMDADFHGRTDEDFLVLFLRSCDFDVKLSKKTLRLYYQARIKYPEWWANRGLNEPQIQALIDIKVSFLFLEQHSNYPTVGIVHLSRFGSDPSILNPGGKFIACGLDLMSRRKNCQLHGAVIIYDCGNLPWWMVWKALWPPFIKNAVDAFVMCLPLKIKSVILVNGPAITSTFIKIVNAFLSEELKNKILCCRNWSEIGQYVPLDVVPNEYGGYAGPAKVHEDASVVELSAMIEYFKDDNKYGFLSNM